MAPAIPPDIEEEVEILRAIYGDEPVRIVEKHKSSEDSDSKAVCWLEVDLSPVSEDGVSLVFVTISVMIPEGYPAKASPKIEVEKSRGIGDVASEAMMDAAKSAVEAHGLQDIGCLSPLIAEVKDALGKAVSECSICMMDCDPSDAIFVACNCVFHKECLEQWRGLKDKEKSTKADAATESVKSERDSLEKQRDEAREQVESAEQQVSEAQLGVDAAAAGVEAAMKKAQAAANEEEEDDDQAGAGEDDDEECEDSGSELEMDPENIDYRNEAKWGAPEVSIGGRFANKNTKKNWHPSVRMNRKRPKKYLKRIDEKLEDLKKAAKQQTTEEMEQAVTHWEKARFKLKEAKSVLEQEQEQLKKAKEREEKLDADLAWIEAHLAQERSKFTSLPLLCPVCQNEVDEKQAPLTEEAAQEVNEEQEASGEPELTEEEKRRAALEAEEEERKRKKAAAEMAAVEAQMLFKMTGGTAGTQRRPLTAAPDLSEGEEMDSASPGKVPLREDELLHEDRPSKEALPQEEQPSPEALREVCQVESSRGKEEEVKAKTAKKNKRSAKQEEQKRNDEELLATIGQLMEAYTEKSVDPSELLSAFEELLSVLAGSRSATDVEIREVLAEMVETLKEDRSEKRKTKSTSRKKDAST
eukprot:TRINITY_DN88360_c0_g1_i1.p1 TRINITY_DN88360_c0_g1~~TRINITY_DN88360_c0_g1_i1.p1  ORF type:complete len:656 (-),score=219.07 TRINITY_DN88360_c0_g1_i1:37-1959(-)